MILHNVFLSVNTDFDDLLPIANVAILIFLDCEDVLKV